MAEAPVTERVAIVTGGARGIGRSIVERLHADGWHVVAFDVNAKAIAAMADDVAQSSGIEVEEVSITDRPAVEAAVGSLVERFGAIGAVVNNAGMTLPATFLDQEDDDWHTILDVNLTGTFIVSQTVARHMVDAGAGSIVNVGSVSAHGVRTGPPSYAAAKAGVEGLSRLMAVQLGPLGVRVNTVVVGTTATPWLLGRKSPDELAAMTESTLTGRLGDPADVAAAVAFLVSPDSGHVTGQMISVSGGQWMP